MEKIDFDDLRWLIRDWKGLDTSDETIRTMLALYLGRGGPTGRWAREIWEKLSPEKQHEIFNRYNEHYERKEEGNK